MKTKLLQNHLQNRIFSGLSHAFVSFILVLVLCPEPCVLSQIPQGFNYQAIARDGSGNAITNASMPVRLTIQADSAGTIVIWQELFSSVTTNSFGLFTLVVGRGVRQSGSAATFDAIDWSVTPKFIKTEINYSGWKDMGTTRFWSVPYSIRAKDTETKQTLSLAGSDLTISGGNTVSFPGGINLWQAKDTNAYRISGRVGIGTSTPAKKLQVVGDAAIGTNWYMDGGIELGQTGSGNRYSGIDFHGDDTYTDYALRILRYNTGPNAMSGIVHRGTGEFQIGTQDAGFLTLFTNSTERLRVTASGNVGINTASPNSLLNPYLTIGDGLNNTSEIMDLTIKPSGNTDYLRFYGIRKTAGTDWTNVALRIQQRVDATDMGFIEFNPSPVGQDLAFGTANIERLRITSGGNIGIGTATPTSKLVINPSTSWDDDTPLFEVKNKDGYTVFAVYNKGVRILVERNDAKGTKGGFAIGGFDPTKGPGTFDLASISLDSVRFNINNAASKGSTKGGFAIGSFDNSKGSINQDFMYITPQASSKGLYNTFMGFQSGYSNSSTGNYNTFLGYNSGYTNTDGDDNVFLGYRTGITNSTGSDNVFIGMEAGLRVTNGYENVMIGKQAGVFTTSGYRNTFLGESSGYYNTTGFGNTFLGLSSGMGNTTGAYNVYIGEYSGNRNQAGLYNTFIGYYCSRGSAANNGNNNTCLGAYAGYSCTGYANLCLGYQSGYGNTTGFNNTMIGTYAGSGNVTGTGNVFLGYSAGGNETGSNKLYIANKLTNPPLIYGDFSARTLGFGTITPGAKVEINSDPTSLLQLRLRDSALNRKWDIAVDAGFGDATNDDLYILNNAGTHVAVLTNSGSVGIGTNTPGTYKLYIVGSAYCSGTWAGSDIRWKKNISPLEYGLNDILRLKGVNYEWRQDEFPANGFDSGKQIGLIAQEVEKVFPELVKTDDNGYKAVSYEKLSVVLLKGMQEQQVQIETQRKEIDELKALVSNLIAGKPGQVNK